MKPVQDTRRDNLRELINNQFDGHPTRLARAAGVRQASLVSRYTTDRPSARKRMGERFARKIEAALQLEPGWMDIDHTVDDMQDERVLRERLAAILDEVAVGLNGAPPPNVSWSYHDLGDKAALMRHHLAVLANDPGVQQALGPERLRRTLELLK